MSTLSRLGVQMRTFGICPRMEWARFGSTLRTVAPLLVVVLATNLGFSVGSHLPPKLRETSYLICSFILVAGLFWIVFSFVRGERLGQSSTESPHDPDVAWVLLYVCLSIDLYFTLSNLLTFLSVVSLWLVGGGARLLRRDSRLTFAFGWFALLGLMVFVVCRMNLGPDDSGMDLLPITKAAIHNALHGRNPYLADYTSITTGPFFYLPPEWISYAPFEIAGINLRWINLFCWLGIIVIFERSAMKAVDRSLARAAFYPVMAAFPVFQAMDSHA